MGTDDVGVDPVRAVLLDALGTLLRLEPPAPALRAELRRRCGIEVDDATARRAMAAEVAYYREHSLEGSDAPSLVELRRRCAGVLREALGSPAAGADPDCVRDALLASLRFVPYPDAAPALERMRAAGVRLVVVSNWDVSLHDRLAECGLDRLVHGAVASAQLGVAKPSAAIFAHALSLAGVRPESALHVGDSPAEDVEGARAAGIEPLLLVREGEPPRAPRVRVARSLAEVADLVA